MLATDFADPAFVHLAGLQPSCARAGRPGQLVDSVGKASDEPLQQDPDTASEQLPERFGLRRGWTSNRVEHPQTTRET